MQHSCCNVSPWTSALSQRRIRSMKHLYKQASFDLAVLSSAARWSPGLHLRQWQLIRFGRVILMCDNTRWSLSRSLRTKQLTNNKKIKSSLQLLSLQQRSVQTRSDTWDVLLDFRVLPIKRSCHSSPSCFVIGFTLILRPVSVRAKLKCHLTCVDPKSATTTAFLCWLDVIYSPLPCS